jgi:hypothetical protein
MKIVHNKYYIGICRGKTQSPFKRSRITVRGSELSHATKLRSNVASIIFDGMFVGATCPQFFSQRTELSTP